MFFRRFFFAVFFVLLLFFGLAAMRHQSGYARGFEQGYAAAAQDFAAEKGTESAEPAQPAPAAPGHQSWGLFPGVGLFGMFFQCLLILAAFAFFMKLLFFGRRHRWKDHRSGPWSHHGHWGKWGHHHGRSPGREDGSQKRPQKGDDDYEKQPEDVDPDVRSY